MRTLVQRSFKKALDENDILISPAAPSAAYMIGVYPLSARGLAFDPLNGGSPVILFSLPHILSFQSLILVMPSHGIVHLIVSAFLLND